MIAGHLFHPIRQFSLPENKRHLFYLYYEISRGYFTNENASRISLHQTDIYRHYSFGAHALSFFICTTNENVRCFRSTCMK